MNSDDRLNCIMDNLEDASSIKVIEDLAEYLEIQVKPYNHMVESYAGYEQRLIMQIIKYITGNGKLINITFLYLNISLD